MSVSIMVGELKKLPTRMASENEELERLVNSDETRVTYPRREKITHPR